MAILNPFTSTCPTSCCNNNVNQSVCPDKFGCPPGVCPDFEIKQHDTQPPFRISVHDCDRNPLDLTNTVAEVSMWAKAKLKKSVLATDTFFGLADDIGFEQADVGDIIVIDRARNPEQMVITGFDENLKLIQVQRGHNGTQPSDYPKGKCLRIFRILNAVADTNMVFQNVKQVDNSTKNVQTDSQLIYTWFPHDTCLPGCFFLEFKLLKMIVIPSPSLMPGSTDLMFGPLNGPMNFGMNFGASISSIPVFVSVVNGCEIGSGVEWVRRFPIEGDGFLIKIVSSPTAENIA